MPRRYDNKVQRKNHRKWTIEQEAEKSYENVEIMVKEVSYNGWLMDVKWRKQKRREVQIKTKEIEEKEE